MLQGFAELEYGILRYMGAIDDSTPVVTSGKCSFCSIFLPLFYLVIFILFAIALNLIYKLLFSA